MSVGSMSRKLLAQSRVRINHHAVQCVIASVVVLSLVGAARAVDCNANSIPDACDIACGAPGGPCDVPGCGTKSDCNSNGVPDDCELVGANASLTFDGVNDVVRVPRSASLEPASELTVEAWIRPDALGGYHNRIVRKSADFGAGFILAASQGGDHRLQLRIDSAQLGNVNVIDTVTLSTYLNQWHHVAAVYSAPGDFARLYVDGVLRASQNARGTLNYSVSDLFIGNMTSSEAYSGQMDEVRVWNVARTAQQINDNMGRQLLGTESGLVAYLRMDEGSGQVVGDASGHNNNGVRGTDSAAGGDSADPAWLTNGAPIITGDCNINGVLDSCEIASGAATDCNANGTPDACEPGGTTDCDNDGTLDLCEATNVDCNHNGIPDYCDLANGTSVDINSTGIPDECEFFLITERVRPCGRMFLIPESAIDGVHIFSRSGSPLGVLLPGQLDYTGAPISFDSAGNLLVSEWNRNRVSLVSRTGTLVRTLTAGGLSGPRGATLTPSGDIAVCSYLSDSIKFYKTDGTYLSNLSGTEDPLCLAYDRAGNLFVGCRNNGSGFIRQFDAQLQVVQTFGQGDFAPHPLELAFDADENLYATTPGSVKKYSHAGAPLTPLAAPGLSPNGIAIDDTGVIWVTNSSARNIFRFAANGTYIDTIPVDFGPGVPASAKVSGIAFDIRPDTDCNNNGTPDACDINAGTSADCNLNGLPDSCEISGHDCDSNGVLDSCQPDCDHDGTPDVCEITAGAADCNANTIPDSCEIISGGPTTQPVGTIRNPANGHFYRLTASTGSWAAQEAEAVAAGGHLATVRNAAENQWLVTTFAPLLTPASAFIGINDIAIEGTWVWPSGEPVGYSNWAAGEPNNAAGGEDYAEFYVRDSGSFTAGQWVDISQPRFGIMEIIPTNDCNHNGALDACDISSGTSQDCNADGVPDECQPVQDCNANGIRDLCEIGGTADCDGNGVTNWCQVAAGAPDCDGNRIPDSCEIGAGNSAVYFDGINDIVVVPRSPTLEPANELTVEAWVKADSAGAYHARLIRNSVATGYILAWQQSGDGHVQLRMDQGGNAVVAADNVPTSTYFGQWVHVAGVYSATQHFCRLYVNGVLKDNKTANGTLVYSNSAFAIGNSFYGNESFYGRIDEMRVWNVARTQQQLNDNKSKRLSGSEPGLVGYWRFDEGSGQVVADASGHGNNGTIGGNNQVAGDDPTWVTAVSGTPSPSDCNGNGIPDECDIAAGAADCNSNSIPDSCEADCNGNGVPDDCDVAAHTVPDCNHNNIPDACDIASGSATDVNSDGVPDTCQPDIRIIPVISMIDPGLTTETRTTEPTSLTAVSRSSYYYVEIWATDLGANNTGLTGAYVNVGFCTQTAADSVYHGNTFTTFPGGTIQSGQVSGFGGSALPNGGGITPQWVRIGWIRMTAALDTPACHIALTPAAGGVAAFNRGLINPAFINFGAADLLITPPARSYDLDNSGVVNVGDLSLFAPSWLHTVPPAASAHDFDCDDAVGVADLSWFATAWNKSVSDPTILYPPCGGGAPLLRGGSTPVDVDFRLAVLASPSSSDIRTSVPNSLASINAGQIYHVEVWASDLGDVNTGLTSAYVNLGYPSSAASVLSISHGSIFTSFPSGSNAAGVVSELGGSSLNADNGNAPLWVRVARVQMFAESAPSLLVYQLLPSNTGVAAYGRGAIPWPAVALATLRIGTPAQGDFNEDGQITSVDLQTFIAVVLGTDTNAQHIQRADMNQDTLANGRDVQGFVSALLGS